MPRTLYLHCGPPKTGTSAIQAYLRDNTRCPDLLYPRAGQWGDGAHHFLTFAVQGKTARGDIAIPPLAELRADLAAEITASTCDVLISSEGLTPKDSYAAFRTAFAEVIAEFDRVETLVVLRHPLERAASSYNQNLKDAVISETRLPDDYLLQHRRGFALMPFVRNWRAVEPATRFLSYHPARGLVPRFLAALGREHVADTQRARRNASLGGRVSVALLAANRMGLPPKRRAAFFAELRADPRLPLHKGRNFLFSESATRQFLDAVAGDLVALRDALGIDLTGLYPAPPERLALGPVQASGLRRRLQSLNPDAAQQQDIDRVLALFQAAG